MHRSEKLKKHFVFAATGHTQCFIAPLGEDDLSATLVLDRKMSSDVLGYITRLLL